MKCAPVHHGVPAVLHRDEPWLHRHSENGALTVLQGRRRLLESGTAIKRRRRSPSVEGTCGGELERGYVPLSLSYPGSQIRLPCTPQDNFSWVPNCSLGPPGCETKVSSKKFGLGYV